VALATWENLERRHVFLTFVRACATCAIVLAVYFTVPIGQHPNESIVLRLSVGLALFVSALAYEVRAITRADRPLLRAADALALVIPLFVVVFAWTYLTMAQSSVGAFSAPLDRVSALYFTVTVLSTVGFGDIAPRTDAARLTVTLQMGADLVLVALVVRLILEAARGTFGRAANAGRSG
jgi:voltage-gated potassium channel